MVFSIVITILALGAMICIHEMGHMVAAKCFGVYVKEFSIGMGPKLFSIRPRETVYSLRLLPIGGYVQMEGEGYDGDGEEPVDTSRSFRHLKPWKRFIILAAGATLNVILGLVIFAVVNINSSVVPTVITGPSEGYEKVSVFKAGDEILRVGGSRTHTYQDVVMKLSEPEIQKRDSVDVVVRRDGKKLTLDAPLYGKEGGKLMMVGFEAIYKPGFFTSLRYAVYDTGFVVKAVVGAVGDLITGRQSVDSLSGPVEIVSVVDDVSSAKSPYTWLSLLSLFALITVNLGVFNLLPIPALDGGQILFLLIEKIIGKEIKPSVAGTINTVFFALLMLLAVYVTVDDIAGLIK